MPECQNCGSVVSKQFVRVFSPNEDHGPRVCPHCPDKVRDGREVRDAASPRRGDSSNVDFSAAEGGDA